MKALLSLIISGALVVSGYAQTRNVLVGTNNAVVQPTNFWSADASNARVGLGLDTAATNPASAFQSSSSTLSNLAISNGASLTNLTASNIVGTLSIAQGGTGATNSANARQNLGSTTVGDAVFIATNAEAARTAIGALSTNGSAAGLTNFPTVSLASNVTGTIAIINGGSGATTAGGARTNFGLGNISTNTYLVTNTAVYINTNIVATNGTLKSINIQSDYVESPYFLVSDGTNGIVFESSEVKAITRTNLGIGAGATNTVGFGKIISSGDGLSIEEPASPATIIGFPSDTDPVVLGAAYWNHGSVRQSLGFSTNLSNFWTSASIAAGRTNLGLPLAALTNTNNADFLAAFFGANTNPVLVNTSGQVVSPTNFWQVAPIATLLQNSTPVVNATNAATNARLLFLFSLAPSTVGVTNTITLPTNGGTFNGDVATITHSGPTNSVTAVRQLGSSTNIITLDQVDESVRFLYRNNQWTLMDNISYIEPIYFSGTNAAANAEASRTNLGLPLAALTNTSVTNFQKAIFYTNTAPSNIGGNLGTIAAWIEIVASDGVTYKVPAYTNVP